MGYEKGEKYDRREFLKLMARTAPFGIGSGLALGLILENTGKSKQKSKEINKMSVEEIKKELKENNKAIKELREKSQKLIEELERRNEELEKVLEEKSDK